MGMKYCPNCKQIVITKALGSYSQVVVNGVPGKRRKISFSRIRGWWYTDATISGTSCRRSASWIRGQNSSDFQRSLPPVSDTTTPEMTPLMVRYLRISKAKKKKYIDNLELLSVANIPINENLIRDVDYETGIFRSRRYNAFG